jgi:hypothetical protein
MNEAIPQRPRHREMHSPLGGRIARCEYAHPSGSTYSPAFNLLLIKYALERVLYRIGQSQYIALHNSPYIRMTPSEADAYDARRLRIGQICELLADFRSKSI